MTKNIVVIGSTNVDKVLNVERYAQPGETLSVTSPQVIKGGGKGANQAIAAARSGAKTTFISKLGTEGNADFMVEGFKEDGINTDSLIWTDKYETGQAYITVEGSGQNTIYVYGGANMAMTPADVDQLGDVIGQADTIIAQLEIPTDTIIEAFRIAREHGVKTILNPAPAKQLPEQLIVLTDIIVPNETEAALLSGIEVTDEQSLMQNAQYFFDKGIQSVIITLGEKGSFYATAQDHGVVKPQKVTNVVDTTAAGDTFIGALSTHLENDLSNLTTAMAYASQASALTIQTQGAQNSIPTTAQIEAVYGEMK